MADVTVTAASVLQVSGQTKDVVAGEAITAGDWVYEDSTASGKAKKADTSSQAKATVTGMALNSAPAADQPLRIATSGVVKPGGTLTVGTIYVASDNGGKLRPAADNGSGDWVTELGVATAADTLKIGLNVSGVQVP